MQSHSKQIENKTNDIFDKDQCKQCMMSHFCDFLEMNSYMSRQALVYLVP